MRRTGNGTAAFLNGLPQMTYLPSGGYSWAPAAASLSLERKCRLLTHSANLAPGMVALTVSEKSSLACVASGLLIGPVLTEHHFHSF